MSGADSIRVLVADDDAVARTLLRGVILAERDLELVGIAQDTDQAIAMAVEQQPDVAVLDWVMPGGGGTIAATEIVERSPGTRIVALTASESQYASLDMLRAGANAFVVKGAPTDELVEAIRSSAQLRNGSVRAAGSRRGDQRFER